MQNFGRGMWRRVGDYEKIHVPIINKNTELEYYLALMEYHKKQRLKQTFNTYQKQNMKNHTNIINNQDLLVNIDKTNSEEVINQPVVSEEFTKE